MIFFCKDLMKIFCIFRALCIKEYIYSDCSLYFSIYKEKSNLIKAKRFSELIMMMLSIANNHICQSATNYFAIGDH